MGYYIEAGEYGANILTDNQGRAVFTYKCTRCNEKFEKLIQLNSRDFTDCPMCQGYSVKQKSGIDFIDPKGRSGFTTKS